MGKSRRQNVHRFWRRRAAQYVAAVIEDFHFQSLHNQVKPCLLVVGDLRYSQLYLKISSAQARQTIEAAEQKNW
ncbi:MAG: hypothetical protein H6559_21445 [Lewinellaceae bacterium]|nr:hypothetical protein [Lewinellaceae bacterium]